MTLSKYTTKELEKELEKRKTESGSKFEKMVSLLKENGFIYEVETIFRFECVLPAECILHFSWDLNGDVVNLEYELIEAEIIYDSYELGEAFQNIRNNLATFKDKLKTFCKDNDLDFFECCDYLSNYVR
jgi:hypothetical protein